MVTPQDLMIRPEHERDHAAVHAVNATAFGRRAEADLVAALRGRGDSIISLVACDASRGGAVVGHVLFTPVTVECEGESFRAMALGPIAVLPEWQRRGIGSRLIEAGLATCREAGERIVFVVGDPGFYARFGFAPAKGLGIAWDRPVPDEIFMVLAQSRDALRSRTRARGGVVHYLPEFDQV